MYLDTSYIAKFYLNEPESIGVRELVRTADSIRSSFWAYAEFHAVLLSHVRQNEMSRAEMSDLARRFSQMRYI